MFVDGHGGCPVWRDKCFGNLVLVILRPTVCDIPRHLPGTFSDTPTEMLLWFFLRYFNIRESNWPSSSHLWTVPIISVERSNELRCQLVWECVHLEFYINGMKLLPWYLMCGYLFSALYEDFHQVIIHVLLVFIRTVLNVCIRTINTLWSQSIF